MFCHICGNNVGESEYCNICGVKIVKAEEIVQNLNYDTGNHNNTNPTYYSKKKNVSNNDKRNIISIILVILFLLTCMTIVGLLFVYKSKHNNSKILVDENITEYIQNEEDEFQNAADESDFDNPYLVDYMILAKQLEWEDQSHWNNSPENKWGSPDEVIIGFEVCDCDSDGDYELVVETIPTDSSYYATQYVLDAKKGIYGEWNNRGAAGYSTSMISNNNGKYYLKDGYAVVTFENKNYYAWTDEGWSLQSQYSFVSDISDGDCDYTWEGKNVSKEEWIVNENDLDLRDINDEIYNYQSLATEADAQNAAKSIFEYYKQEKEMDAFLVENTENNEFYVIIDNYFTSTWINEIRDGDTLVDFVGFTDWDEIDSTRMEGSKYPNSIVISVTSTEEGSVITSLKIDNDKEIGKILDAGYEDGMVLITSNENKYYYEVNNNGLFLKKKAVDKIENKDYSDAVYDELLERLKSELYDEKSRIKNENEDIGAEIEYLYAYFDIEEDGINELIVLINYSDMIMGVSQEARIYSFLNGEVIQLNIPYERYSQAEMTCMGNGMIATLYYDGIEDNECYFYSINPDKSFTKLEEYTHEYSYDEYIGHYYHTEGDYVEEIDRDTYYSEINNKTDNGQIDIHYEVLE